MYYIFPLPSIFILLRDMIQASLNLHWIYLSLDAWKNHRSSVLVLLLLFYVHSKLVTPWLLCILLMYKVRTKLIFTIYIIWINSSGSRGNMIIKLARGEGATEPPMISIHCHITLLRNMIHKNVFIKLEIFNS